MMCLNVKHEALQRTVDAINRDFPSLQHQNPNTSPLVHSKIK